MVSLGKIQIIVLNNNNIFICIILVDALPGDKRKFKLKAIISYELFETILPQSQCEQINNCNCFIIEN